MPYHIGDTIGEHVIRGHIGSGASGSVYRVEHTLTGRVDALKVISRRGEDPDADERLLREAKLQSRLNHPNIAALHNAFYHQGNFVLVMEFVEGRSLADLLSAGPVPRDTAFFFARQLLAAVSHAHHNGVVHRDISPANIIITPHGRLKLTDFGLAKAPDGRTVTRNGTMLGSVFYSSPEQIQGLPGVDSRTDIYSCGVVLYELFTHRKPFDGETVFELMLAHAAGTAPKPDLPLALGAAVLRALEKDRDRRFPDAAAFWQAVDQSRHPLRRIPESALAAAGFGVVVLALLLVVLSRQPDLSPIPPKPEAPPVRAVTVEVPAIRPDIAPIPPLPEAVMPLPSPAPVRGVEPALLVKTAPRKAKSRTFIPTASPSASSADMPPAPALQDLPSDPIPKLMESLAAAQARRETDKNGFWRNLRRKVNPFHKPANPPPPPSPSSKR